MRTLRVRTASKQGTHIDLATLYTTLSFQNNPTLFTINPQREVESFSAASKQQSTCSSALPADTEATPVMASSARDKDQVTSSLSNLKLDGAKESTKSSKQKQKGHVADSWDDGGSSSSDDEAETPTSKASIPSAPPPTPVTPHYTSAPDWSTIPEPGMTSPREAPAAKRPEKTDAVARRMIAAGLGLKAPKQTEEQKAYQKSIREQERKKREQEKADEQKRLESAEKTKASMWDD